jgi:starch synthase
VKIPKSIYPPSDNEKMAHPLNILFVSAECVPFAKTGGLGDVTGSLPFYLRKKEHRVIIVMPQYSFIEVSKYGITTAIEKMNVRYGKGEITCRAGTTALPGNVSVYFIDYEPYFGRTNIYNDDNFIGYSDNPRRFAFLSLAALQLCRELNFLPDIVHSNDWHTALMPAFLKRTYRDDPFFSKTASVLTIHNIAYQGIYESSYYYETGLGAEDFTPDKFECYNAVNFLKGGIRFADMVNTVSISYAAEIKTPSGGYGLDHYLRTKGDDFEGILNGVDYSQWDPGIDALIPENYSSASPAGKAVCKRALQEQFGLNQVNTTPLIGIVSRLVDQKGFYILAECIEEILNTMDVQFAILGSGDNYLEDYYSGLDDRYKGITGTYIGYSNELAHLTEAGSDFLLMPSLSEPCGLTQIYALRYGTLPIVRATGGLNDTVENYNQETGNGTGFKFSEPSGKAIYNTVKWALETYNNRKAHFEKLIINAMEQNFSWDKSAEEYIQLYGRAIENSHSREL